MAFAEFFSKDEWIYPKFDVFSVGLLKEKPLLHSETSSALCDDCLNIDLEIPLSSLHARRNDCVLCQILSKLLNKAETRWTNMSLLQARSYVRICAVPEWSQHDSRASKLIQTGLPVFLQSGSPSHFRLIKEWLRFCDDGKCTGSSVCCPKPIGALPTRVIDVGEYKISVEDKVGPDIVRLISTDKKQDMHYAALSHCWGSLTEEQKDNWCTTCSNEKDRRTQGFLVEQLPATFQDAIRVTREIGKRYLWIDSLCIIQGDGGDWATEAKKMETVFRGAYCTIAATSAEDSTRGFLNRPLEVSNSQYVTVPNSSHGNIYVCTSIDDFPGDVQEGVLNKRAWVLQERAMSRRTIHFTKRQTYWECGGGVRCETLTYMRNEKVAFRSDPEFPRSFLRRTDKAQIELFQSLFADYSNLGLTEETDRPIAIDSLAMALGEALDTRVRHGVFESHLHESLLWQRPQNISLTRIHNKAGQALLPSWSWMAYSGPIEYPEMQDVEWDPSVQFVEDLASDAAGNPGNDGYVLKARVARLRGCEENDTIGHLCFDNQLGNASTEVQCAIIGRKTGDFGWRWGWEWEWKEPLELKCEYYVLLVVECATRSDCRSFERIGMGLVNGRFIPTDIRHDVAQIL